MCFYEIYEYFFLRKKNNNTHVLNHDSNHNLHENLLTLSTSSLDTIYEDT